MVGQNYLEREFCVSEIYSVKCKPDNMIIAIKTWTMCATALYDDERADNSRLLDWDDDEATVNMYEEIEEVIGEVTVWESTEADVENDEESAEAAILGLTACTR